MKPIKLIFQAFGPYAGREEIDFRSLSSKGLFLICGETGSGKTTMLDAMTFALFGMSSGDNRNDFSAMRCTKAEFGVDTIVSFEFENNGHYYLFERKLECKRKNLSPSYNACIMNEDGVWEPFFENPKSVALDAKAQEILGLDFKQFRQVIVLPQGQFEKLLTSNSDEKEQILATIFGEKRWERVARKMAELAEQRYFALKDKQASIATSLSEEGCGSIAELGALVEGKEAELKALETQSQNAEYDRELEMIQKQLTLAARFRDMRGLEDKKARLEAGLDAQTARRDRLALANKAEKVKDAVKEADKATRDLTVRCDAVSTAEGRVTAADKKVVATTEALLAHNNRASEIENINKQAIEYAGKRKDYAELDTLKKAYQSKQRECNEAEAERKKLEASRDTRRANAEKLQQDYEYLLTKHTSALSAYMSGISGILAESLITGNPCPVCGSTEHPKKAVKSDTAVTREAVDELKAECDEKYAALQTANAALVKASEALEAAGLKVQTLTGELSTAKANYENVKLVEGIADSAALERKIFELEGMVSSYKTEGEKLLQREKDAKEEAASVKANLETAKKEVETATEAKKTADDNLAKSLKDNGFADRNEAVAAMLSADKMAALQEEISKYDADVAATGESLADIVAELKGIEEPDFAALNTKQHEINEAKDQLVKQMTKLKTENDRLKVKFENLSKKGAGLEAELNVASEELSFAKKLRGDSGISLQRYVLGIMFTSVIAAANQMLELVHEGRYHLFRTDDRHGSGRKGGLELKVMDKYSDNPDGRFVNTLSGGEKFLVSLALSIGLSTIAQRGGIRIEALFIDEGFGSLDSNSIEDAMSILETVQKANGTVGIISHVQLLRERIPTKLMVKKGEGTSHIEVAVG